MLYDDKQFIGNIVKTARKQRKLSQAELSEKLGMTEKNLGNIENGKQFPQVNNFLRIIEVLDLSLEDFGVNMNNKTDNILRDNLTAKILTSSSQKLELYNEAVKIIDNACKFKE